MTLKERRANIIKEHLAKINKPLIKARIIDVVEPSLAKSQVGKYTSFNEAFNFALEKNFIKKYDKKHYVWSGFNEEKIGKDILIDSKKFSRKNYSFESFTVAEIIALYDAKLIDVPNIQRKFEAWDYKYEIIDGQHRIMSIISFVNLSNFFEKQNVGEKFMGIKKKKTDTFFTFIQNATKDFKFDRICSEPINFLYENFDIEIAKLFLEAKLNVWIVNDNDSIASSIFIYLNSTGESLLSGELMRSKILDGLKSKDDIKKFNETLSMMKIIPIFNKGNLKKRYRYLLPSLIPQFVSGLSPEDNNIFRTSINIEAKIKEWIYELDDRKIKKIIKQQRQFYEKIEKSKAIINFKTIKKISEFYMLSLFFYNHQNMMNDEIVLNRIPTLLEIWNEFSSNKDIKREYFSRSPQSILFSRALADEILLNENTLGGPDDKETLLRKISSKTKNG